ncbi:peptidylprolyl isomerase [Pararhodonellum marinum]|uniref:peptidylprolyl isomerase n=1 Tax=Pararhodonellum marinum TaxID=2755358 RepID=UPI00188ECF7D|nr:peptidylprolyl isomerase [Pararhodonellum marinum]
MKIKHLCFLLLFSAAACSPKITQDTQPQTPLEDAFLLQIGGDKISSDEFMYIMSKGQNFQQEDHGSSREELDKNLDLFINYKLKVKEAEALGLDQSEEFEREFTMFKEDLKKPFLLENSLQEGELRKAYARSLEVIKASHILLQFPGNASKEDSIAVFSMAQLLKEKAEAGEDFNELALEYSDDPSVKNNKGNLGYFSALQMVYAFEDAAYSLKPGEVSEPILTNFGYHIIRVEDRKPNPGEVKVSHILIRSDGKDANIDNLARRKVVEIYAELQKEESNWEDVCRMYSEDAASKNNGGQLPWFGVGAIIPEFENAAFDLQEIGEISPPVKTPYGYHIIRLEDRKGVPAFEEAEPALKSKILRDSRSSLIKSQVLAMQKERFGFKENEALVDTIQSIINEHSIQKLTEVKAALNQQNLMNSNLFSIKGESTTIQELITFIEDDKSVMRTVNARNFEPWYDKLVETKLAAAEEKDLYENNPEYRLLVQEYREGILLFSLMNEQVWQKALEDSLGQLAYFNSHLERYQWEERVPALIVKMDKADQARKVRQFLQGKTYQKDLYGRLETTFLEEEPLLFTMEDGLFEWEKHPILQQIPRNDQFGEINSNGKLHLVLKGKALPAGPKKLEDTRGKVIQDYQEHLDQQLIARLKEKYEVQINEEQKEKVFNLAAQL